MGNRTITRAITVNRWLTLRKAEAMCVLCLLYFFLMLVSPAEICADDKKRSDSIVITSRTMMTDNKANTALFEGSVIAKKGDLTLYADKMLVYYSEQKSGSNVKQVDAESNVKLIKGERVITAAFAVYFSAPEERVVFTGDPRASDGESIVTGSRMTYFIKGERSLVEDSKVFMQDRSQ